MLGLLYVGVARVFSGGGEVICDVLTLILPSVGSLSGGWWGGGFYLL